MKNVFGYFIVFVVLVSCKDPEEEIIEKIFCESYFPEGIDESSTKADYSALNDSVQPIDFFNALDKANSDGRVNFSVYDTTDISSGVAWQIGGFNTMSFYPGGATYKIHFGFKNLNPKYYIVTVWDPSKYTSTNDFDAVVGQFVNEIPPNLLDEEDDEQDVMFPIKMPKGINGRVYFHVQFLDEGGHTPEIGAEGQITKLIDYGGNPSLVGKWEYCKSVVKNLKADTFLAPWPFYIDYYTTLDTIPSDCDSENKDIMLNRSEYFIDTIMINEDETFYMSSQYWYSDSIIRTDCDIEAYEDYAIRSVRGLWRFDQTNNSITFSNEGSSYYKPYKWYETYRFYDEAYIIDDHLVLGRVAEDTLFSYRIYSRLD